MFIKNSVILIVDDSAAARSQLRAELKELGYLNVIEAENGARGLLRITAAEKSGAPVSLVISDWNMPQMNGLEFLNKVRSTPHLAHLPFIALTLSTEVEDVVKAVNAGVNSYLMKPYDIKGLRESLESVYRRLQVKF